MVIGDDLLKNTELVRLCQILGLCPERWLRLAIRNHIRFLSRDEFIDFAKAVLKFFDQKGKLGLTLGQLSKVPVLTRTTTGVQPTSLTEKLRGRDNAKFWELQPNGGVEAIKTKRPVYSRCILPQICHFLEEVSLDEVPDLEDVKPHFTLGFYIELCGSW